MASRRPVQFWKGFNDWWRGELDRHGRRPVANEINDWYEANAERVWPPEIRPSAHETRVHAKCLRSVDAVRIYFRKYRAVKRREPEMDDDWEEDGGHDGTNDDESYGESNGKSASTEVHADGAGRAGASASLMTASGRRVRAPKHHEPELLQSNLADLKLQQSVGKEKSGRPQRTRGRRNKDNDLQRVSEEHDDECQPPISSTATSWPTQGECGDDHGNAASNNSKSQRAKQGNSDQDDLQKYGCSENLLAHHVVTHPSVNKGPSYRFVRPNLAHHQDVQPALKQPRLSDPGPPVHQQLSGMYYGGTLQIAPPPPPLCSPSHPPFAPPPPPPPRSQPHTVQTAFQQSHHDLYNNTQANNSHSNSLNNAAEQGSAENSNSHNAGSAERCHGHADGGSPTIASGFDLPVHGNTTQHAQQGAAIPSAMLDMQAIPDGAAYRNDGAWRHSYGGSAPGPAFHASWPAPAACMDPRGHPQFKVTGARGQHTYDAPMHHNTALPGQGIPPRQQYGTQYDNQCQRPEPGFMDVATDMQQQHMLARSGAGKGTLYSGATPVLNLNEPIQVKPQPQDKKGTEDMYGHGSVGSPRMFGDTHRHGDIHRKGVMSPRSEDAAHQPGKHCTAPTSPAALLAKGVQLPSLADATCKSPTVYSPTGKVGSDARISKQGAFGKEADGRDTWYTSAAGGGPMPAKTFPYSHPSPYDQNMNVMHPAADWHHAAEQAYGRAHINDGYFHGRDHMMMQYGAQYMHAGHGQLPGRFSDMPMRPPPPKPVSMDTPGYAQPPGHHQLEQQQQYPYDRQRRSLDEQRRPAAAYDCMQCGPPPPPGHQYAQFNAWRQASQYDAEKSCGMDLNVAFDKQKPLQDPRVQAGSASPDGNADLCSPMTHLYQLESDQLDVDINGILSDLSPDAGAPTAQTPCLESLDWACGLASPTACVQHVGLTSSAQGAADAALAVGVGGSTNSGQKDMVVSSPKPGSSDAEGRKAPSSKPSPLMMHVDLQPLSPDELISPHKMFYQSKRAQHEQHTHSGGAQPLKTHVYPHPFHAKQAPQLPSFTSMPAHLPSAFEFQDDDTDKAPTISRNGSIKSDLLLLGPPHNSLPPPLLLSTQPSMNILQGNAAGSSHGNAFPRGLMPELDLGLPYKRQGGHSPTGNPGMLDLARQLRYSSSNVDTCKLGHTAAADVVPMPFDKQAAIVANPHSKELHVAQHVVDVGGSAGLCLQLGEVQTKQTSKSGTGDDSGVDAQTAQMKPQAQSGSTNTKSATPGTEATQTNSSTQDVNISTAVQSVKKELDTKPSSGPNGNCVKQEPMMVPTLPDFNFGSMLPAGFPGAKGQTIVLRSSNKAPVSSALSKWAIGASGAAGALNATTSSDRKTTVSEQQQQYHLKTRRSNAKMSNSRKRPSETEMEVENYDSAKTDALPTRRSVRQKEQPALPEPSSRQKQQQKRGDEGVLTGVQGGSRKQASELSQDVAAPCDMPGSGADWALPFIQQPPLHQHLHNAPPLHQGPGSGFGVHHQDQDGPLMRTWSVPVPGHGHMPPPYPGAECFGEPYRRPPGYAPDQGTHGEAYSRHAPSWDGGHQFHHQQQHLHQHTMYERDVHMMQQRHDMYGRSMVHPQGQASDHAVRAGWHPRDHSQPSADTPTHHAAPGVGVPHAFLSHHSGPVSYRPMPGFEDGLHRRMPPMHSVPVIPDHGMHGHEGRASDGYQIPSYYPPRRDHNGRVPYDSDHRYGSMHLHDPMTQQYSDIHQGQYMPRQGEGASARAAGQYGQLHQHQPEQFARVAMTSAALSPVKSAPAAHKVFSPCADATNSLFSARAGASCESPFSQFFKYDKFDLDDLIDLPECKQADVAGNAHVSADLGNADVVTPMAWEPPPGMHDQGMAFHNRPHPADHAFLMPQQQHGKLQVHGDHPQPHQQHVYPGAPCGLPAVRDKGMMHGMYPMQVGDDDQDYPMVPPPTHPYHHSQWAGMRTMPMHGQE